jgi:sugar/nucleoside kinase (ribokinase family)
LRDRGVAEGRLPPVPPYEGSNYALLLGSTEPRVQAHVRASCAGARMVGLDSMAHWWTDQPQAMRDLLARVDVLFVDEGELQLATGLVDTTRAVEQLLARGPSLVVVKRGARGAWMARRGEAPIETAAVALAHVADTTGAGDAFAGACMAALGSAPERGDAYALRFATAVASFAVETVGLGGLQQATHDEVERRMQRLA